MALLGFTSVLFIAAIIFGIQFWRETTGRMDEKLKHDPWSIPSTIYANAPHLSAGMPITEDWLVDYLNKLQYLQVTSRVQPGQFLAADDSVLLCPHAPSRQFRGMNTVQVFFKKNHIQRIINPASGKAIDEYALEPFPLADLFGSKWEKRTPVSYNDIPPHLIQAVLSIEDRRFFQHSGVDAIGITRAALHDLRHENFLQGGSTITQQLVKNMYLSGDRTLHRKISEAVMAIALELRLDKKKILELYLNEVYLGQRGSVSIHGVEEASRFFFDKDVWNLSVPEAAIIAGMIQAPQRYNPYEHPEKSLERRDTVLRAMAKTGSITDAQLALYLQSPLSIKQNDPIVNRAPYFSDVVANSLSRDYSPEELHTRNLHIYTTLNSDLQQIAQDSLQAGLERIDKILLKKTGKQVQGSIIVVEPATGHVVAFIGGRNYLRSQYDRVTMANRQAGSSFKPIVYAAAMQASQTNSYGSVFTPASLISDEAWDPDDSGTAYQPVNYDDNYHGVVSVRQALTQSLNVATVRLGDEVDRKSVV